MKPLHTSLRCAWLAAILLTLAVLSPAAFAEEADELGQPVGKVAVPEGLSLEDVKNSIVMTLIGRQWSVKSKEYDRVVGYLKHRSNEARVTLIYDVEKVEVFCVGWQVDKKTGVRKKPEQPRGWLKNIQSDLTKHLNQTAMVK